MNSFHELHFQRLCDFIVSDYCLHGLVKLKSNPKHKVQNVLLYCNIRSIESRFVDEDYCFVFIQWSDI